MCNGRSIDDPAGYVQNLTTGPERGVQRGELVVVGIKCGEQVLSYQLGMRPHKSARGCRTERPRRKRLVGATHPITTLSIVSIEPANIDPGPQLMDVAGTGDVGRGVCRRDGRTCLTGKCECRCESTLRAVRSGHCIASACRHASRRMSAASRVHRESESNPAVSNAVEVVSVVEGMGGKSCQITS